MTLALRCRLSHQGGVHPITYRPHLPTTGSSLPLLSRGRKEICRKERKLLKAMTDRKQVLAAQTRLTRKRLEDDLELAHRSITREAAAKSTLNSGGTIRKLVRTLLEKLGEATTELINAQAKAGADSASHVAEEVRSALASPTSAYLGQCRKTLSRKAERFNILQPDIDRFFDSLTDRATVALADYPKPTELVIAGLRPEKLPKGWERVQRTLEKARAQLAKASDEEDFQSVGLLCRDVLISTAQAVYDADKHGTLDGIAPSDTDAKRQLEAFFAAELPGAGNEELRAHARCAVTLANALTHKRSATFLLGSVCFEATSSVVTLTAIVSVNR